MHHRNIIILLLVLSLDIINNWMIINDHRIAKYHIVGKFGKVFNLVIWGIQYSYQYRIVQAHTYGAKNSDHQI